MGLDDEPLLAPQKTELEILTALHAMYTEEAKMPVLTMTEVCKSWMDQCSNNQEEDALVSGFKDQKDNPFKELKGGCIIL